MRKLSRSRHRYCFEDRRATLKIGLACFFGFGFVRNTKNHRRSTEMRKFSRSRPLHEHGYCFEDRRTTLKIGLAHFLGFGFVRNTKTYRRNTEMRKLSRSRTLHEHRYYFEDRRTTHKIGLACLLGFGFVRNTKTYGSNTEMRRMIFLGTCRSIVGVLFGFAAGATGNVYKGRNVLSRARHPRVQRAGPPIGG